MDLDKREKIACILLTMYPKTNTHNFDCSVWSIIKIGENEVGYIRKPLSHEEKALLTDLYGSKEEIVEIIEHNIIPKTSD